MILNLYLFRVILNRD